MTLANIARDLEKKGCRVMLFDLFGRGWSDGVDNVPHDHDLYVGQMLDVLKSSSLDWMGPDAFNLIGYSLGGAIAVNFTAAHNDKVKRLILLAPAGLVDDYVPLKARVLFQTGIWPKKVQHYFARGALQNPLSEKQALLQEEFHGLTAELPDGKSETEAASGEAQWKIIWDFISQTITGITTPDVVGNMATNEVVGNGPERTTPSKASGTDQASESSLPATPDGNTGTRKARSKKIKPRVKHQLELETTMSTRWMVLNHPGLVAAFRSCMTVEPFANQDEAYKRVGQQRKSKPGSTTLVIGTMDGMIRGHHQKLMINYLGRGEKVEEKIIDKDVVGKKQIVSGEENINFLAIRGAEHHFPMSHHEQTMEAIYLGFGWLADDGDAIQKRWNQAWKRKQEDDRRQEEEEEGRERETERGEGTLKKKKKSVAK